MFIKKIIFTITILLIGWVVFFISYINDQCDATKAIDSMSKQEQKNTGTQPSPNQEITDMNSRQIIDKECEYKSNVYYTECIIELLDKMAAEREWKQRKLETMKHPQINEYDFSGILTDRQKKITEWRQNFEKMRDVWCEGENVFFTGSGVPSSIASCKLEFETRALATLNYTYYDTILKNVYDSDGIADFKPTTDDLSILIKTNKTNRGCIWAGEENCD